MRRGNAAAIDGLDGQDGQDAEEMAFRRQKKEVA